MSDRTFELLEKMYAEFRETFDKVDKRLEKLEEGQKKLEEGQKRLEERQIKLEVKVENEVVEKIKALFDDREVVKESLVSINSKLDEISDKVDKHDIRIQVIEGGKKMTI